MTILYVCRYSQIMASARYRGYGWAERLRGRGHKVKVIYLQRAFQRENIFTRVKRGSFLLRLIALLWRAEVIVFQKYAPPLFILNLLRSKRIIFDFDDRIYDMQLLADRMSRIRSILHAASRIIVSVPALQEELAERFPYLNSKISIIPTLVDLSRFSKVSPDKSESRVIIGWVGTSGGFPYIARIEEQLSKLLNEFGGQVAFRVISERPYIPAQFKFPVENVKWTLGREFEIFTSIDISIMPLDDSERAKSKAGFKAIQSLAAGLPVVVSPIGVNREIIQHGKNGFWAAAPADFYTYLKLLIVDSKLREKMGRAAKKSAAQFDYALWEEPYLKQLLG